MKIKHSLHYIIFIPLLLSFFASIFLTSVKAQDGFTAYPMPMVTQWDNGQNPVPKAYHHTASPELIDLFTNGISGDLTAKKLYVPTPTVIRTPYTDNKGITFYIDDEYPDAVFIDPTIHTDDKLPLTSYTKMCETNQSSVIFYISVLNLIEINSNLSSTQTLLDSTGKKFASTKLSSIDITNAKNNHIIFEYCYNNAIQYNGSTPTNSKTNQPFSRRIIGNSNLSSFQAFPPFLQTGQTQLIAYYDLAKGTVISDAGFTQTSGKSNDVTQGYRLGQFQVIDYNNPLNCDLKNPIVATDLFGKPIVGVQTALGCLPGSFEGVFTVVLRIAIGISAALLLILIGGNAFNIMQGSSNPEKIKNSITNISRGFGALLLIIFSLVFLNIVGVKIIDLNGLGSIGIQQIYGK